MKNFITKIISSVALATFLIVPVVSFAATFNSASNDLPTLRAGNYTKNQSQDALTWTTSANADAGDTVNLAVYYHNTGSDTARNVRVRLSPQTTGTGTTQTFTVNISSDNASTVTGSATFYLSSNQSISFNGNTAWRPNRATSGSTSFPSGQSGYDLFSSQGVNIGDIAPGWETQGNIFVAFRVSSATVSVPTVSTNSATNVTANSATLNGYVNGNGLSTNAWFEYGTTSSFGNSTSQFSYGTGSSNYTAGLSSLSSNTTYYFRAVAQNSQGTVYGSTYSFTTTTSGGGFGVPIVSTNAASNITSSNATLNGYVNSVGSSVNVWFEYGTTTSFGNSTQSVPYGYISANYSAAIAGLLSNATYYFRAVAQNSQGTVYGSTYSFTTSTGTIGNVPSVSTNSATNVTANSATLNGYVNGNGLSTNAWFEYGTTSSFGNSTSQFSYGTGSSNYTAGLSSLSSNTTYYFRAVAQNSQGTVYGSTYSFTTTTSGSTIVTTGMAPVVTTLLATEIVGDIAKLNGLVFASSGQSSSAWFEWGTTTSLGNKTATFNVGALPSIKHSDMLIGLSTGQRYYYRVVAENIYGKTYGAIMSFSAGALDTSVIISTPRTVTRVVTTPVTRVASAPLTLTLDGGAETIMPREERTYHVSWKNESTRDLKDVVLRVIFPQAVMVQRADKGMVAGADNSVILEIGTLSKSASGEMSIVATASRSLVNGELIVVTANMVYTDTAGIQGDAVAYVTQHGAVGQSQLASIFGVGLFPSTILGWAILLLLILILVLIGNILYGRMVTKVQ